MAASEVEKVVEDRGEYRYGFSWPIDTERLPPGLDENTCHISTKAYP